MIQAIKNTLIAQIFKDMGIRIVKANQTSQKPPLPYGVYNVTSSFIKGVGLANESFYESDSLFYHKKDEQYKMTISINFYGVDEETTIDMAKNVRQWFLFLGEEFIQDQNMTVINVGNIENRTTFLVDSYEYKHGFDVQLCLTDEQSKAIDWFEEVIITEGD